MLTRKHPHIFLRRRLSNLYTRSTLDHKDFMKTRHIHVHARAHTQFAILMVRRKSILNVAKWLKYDAN